MDFMTIILFVINAWAGMPHAAVNAPTSASEVAATPVTVSLTGTWHGYISGSALGNTPATLVVTDDGAYTLAFGSYQASGRVDGLTLRNQAASGGYLNADIVVPLDARHDKRGRTVLSGTASTPYGPVTLEVTR